MLPTEIKNELSKLLTTLNQPVTLVVEKSTHVQQGELLGLLSEVAELSDQITLQESSSENSVPRFGIGTNSQTPKLWFTGVPGGHEFSSFILAIMNSAGNGKFPDAELQSEVRSIPGPIRLKTYVSLSCETCPEVVQQLNLMATIHPDFEHETIDGALVPDDIKRLNIQGVPAVFDNNTLIVSGKTNWVEMVQELRKKYGSDNERTVSDTPFPTSDVTIIGGGPAAIAAAIYSARKGLSTTLIANKIGGQVLDTKGIENLISVPYIEGPQLAQKLEAHLTTYPVRVLSHRNVDELTRVNDHFGIRLSTGEHLHSKAVIIATGAKWRTLGIPGESEYIGRGVAFCAHCDGPFFKGKRVIVVGGGNSGIEAALDLSGLATSVTVIEYMPELKADAMLVEKAKLVPNIDILSNTRVIKIIGDGTKVTSIRYENRDTTTTTEVPIDGVFIQIGLVPNSHLVKDWVAVNRNGEIEIDSKCRTNIPRLYAAGDVTTVPFKQIVVAVGEGAKAALAAFEDR